MTVGDRLTTLGGVIAGLGGALTVGYLIYTLEFAIPFWTWVGYLGVISTGLGLVLTVVGLFQRKENPLSQRQRGGDGSTNYQAGGNLSIGRGSDGDG